MALVVLILLVALWFFGYIQIPQLPLQNTVLFTILGKNVTLFDLILTLLILWVIGILPSPFRQIALVLLVLWILSFFGIVVITNFANIIIISLIAGVAFYLISGWGK